MSAVAERIGLQLQSMQEQLVLAGDVQLSRTMKRMRTMWSKARLDELKREEAARQAVAKVMAATALATLTVELPGIVLVNEKNAHEHWGKKHRLRGDVRPTVAMAMRANANARGVKVRPPCTVRITRLAPNELDAGDNIAMACSPARDGVADWLGINDRSPSVIWECKQEKARGYAVRVEVFG